MVEAPKSSTSRLLVDRSDDQGPLLTYALGETVDFFILIVVVQHVQKV